MKIKSLFFISLFGALFFSCDEVDDPYGDIETVDAGDSQYNDTTYNDSSLMVRKVLLEEFTGHKCPNCPKGTTIANNIRSSNPDDVVLVAIHNSGGFSEADPPDYPSDFETETGEILRVNYQAGAFPVGLVSRIRGGNGDAKVNWNSWENTTNVLLADQNFRSPYFKVKLENIYNTSTGAMRISPTVTALKPVTGEVYMAAYILESNIEAPQIDGTVRIANYIHNHVLRVGFPAKGGGKLIFTDPAANDVYTTVAETEELRTMVPFQDWKLENLELVVFIYEANDGEVLWVDEMHLTSN